MKNLKIKLVNLFAIALLLLASSSINAQPGGGGHERGFAPMDISNIITNLSEEQQTKIEAQKTTNLKKMLPLRNKMKENKVKLENLETLENPDMNDIYSVIDELGKTNIEIMKLMADQKQNLRKILTEEQRIIFDMHDEHSRGKSIGKRKHKKCQTD